MNIVRALILLCVAAGGYNYWKHHHVGSRGSSAQSVAASGDFVTLPPVEGQRPQIVFVVAAENCPHEDAQRADRLAEALSQKGHSR
jgi:hypothetical protein